MAEESEIETRLAGIHFGPEREKKGERERNEKARKGKRVIRKKRERERAKGWRFASDEEGGRGERWRWATNRASAGAAVPRGAAAK